MCRDEVSVTMSELSVGVQGEKICLKDFNPLTPQLKPSAQHCHTRFFTGDFAS
jgi:hypothetical protein